MDLNPKAPTGPIQDAWDKHRFDLKLVNPANKRKYDVIVVGSGLELPGQNEPSDDSGITIGP